MSKHYSGGTRAEMTQRLLYILITLVIIFSGFLLFQNIQMSGHLSLLRDDVSLQSQSLFTADVRLTEMEQDIEERLDRITQDILYLDQNFNEDGLESSGLPSEIRLKHVFGIHNLVKASSFVAWDDKDIEMGSLIFDNEKYYLYYHASSTSGVGFRIGLVISDTPYGPWSKYEGNPVLSSGLEAEWDDLHVACAKVIKIDRTYYMLYSGMRHEEYPKWGVGVATATSPMGPWIKHETNPVMDDFGYIGSIIQVGSDYLLYSAYLINNETDQSPLAVATAESVLGPWRKHPENPVIAEGPKGSCNALGFSEVGAIYQDGLVLIFFGGSRYRNTVNPKGNPRESSIGYCYSSDGYKFYPYRFNPVVTARVAGTHYLGEAFAWAEPPLFIVYSTFVRPEDNRESIALNVLSMYDTYKAYLPLVNRKQLEPGTSISIEERSPLRVVQADNLLITIQATYNVAAEEEITAHVYTSYDGFNWDTEELKDDSGNPVLGELLLKKGESVTVTRNLTCNAGFLKIVVQNNDAIQPVYDVKVVATLGS